MILQTKRLRVRGFRDSDRPAVEEWFQDPSVMQYSMGVMGEDEIRQWLVASIENASEPTGHFALVLRETGECIGYVGLDLDIPLPVETKTVIGYRLRSKFWGRGYATEVVRALLDYAFSELQVSQVCATIDPANLASIRVAEKAGMLRAGTVMLEGYTYPDILYTIEKK